jgi:hypothetical protein
VKSLVAAAGAWRRLAALGVRRKQLMRAPSLPAAALAYRAGGSEKLLWLLACARRQTAKSGRAATGGQNNGACEKLKISKKIEK